MLFSLNKLPIDNNTDVCQPIFYVPGSNLVREQKLTSVSTSNITEAKRFCMSSWCKLCSKIIHQEMPKRRNAFKYGHILASVRVILRLIALSHYFKHNVNTFSVHI